MGDTRYYLLSSECSWDHWYERAERTRRAPGSGKDEGLKYAIHARACSYKHNLVDDGDREKTLGP